MSQINAYLTFDGNCREAMTFYKSCIGGELELMTVEGSPMADQFPADQQKRVLHSALTKDSLLLMASDLCGPEERVNGNTVALSLTCDSEEQMQAFFSNLSAGANVTHPIHDFFAGKMGALTDKFGLQWTFYYGNGHAQ
ncbi:VOC family protein [Chitinophaga japonensis]|uniref:PhnB protein n=1 Tax=Chitinophaga japonensis TaxID=104662 RepID=A0A562STC3_CHIJA|nr:VOC family protein [Chitinophaga japonensis]TWI84046.1 PhnB protein [Chitinophaga japonensis]